MLTEKINLNPTKSHLLLPFQNEMCNTHTNHLPFYSILIFQIFALILYWSPYFFTLKKPLPPHTIISISKSNPPTYFTHCSFLPVIARKGSARLLGFGFSFALEFIYLLFFRFKSWIKLYGTIFVIANNIVRSSACLANSISKATTTLLSFIYLDAMQCNASALMLALMMTII